MISLTIDRDISVSKDGWCYDITFYADCECGNKLQAIAPFYQPSVYYECSKCGASFSFDVTPAPKPGDTRIRNGKQERYMKIVPC